ncbi:Trimeric GatFAB AmidoTransferase(AdT) complex subunit [Xylographa trunciseda]|nr:Trimeric GatFAB AmidoTransferase(AdT) complex subunit [Xylographa trunciseda]
MSSLSHVERCLANQKSFRALNAFITAEHHAQYVLRGSRTDEPNPKNTPLAGKLIAVKDNICTVGYPTTCASAILKDFQSPYNANVVQKLEDAGAIVAGKTNLDEFGMGSHSTHSVFGAVHNATETNDEPLSAGGSSGGSAVAVASQQCWAALGTDTGGSVRLPAAYTGIVGFKPSYGLVSRYGVVAYANSMDTVGVLAADSKIVRHVFHQIRGFDASDPTSVRPSTLKRICETVSSRDAHRDGKSLRIGVPTEYNLEELQPVVRLAWLKVLQLLQAEGHSVHSVSLPATKLALSAYYVIAPAEASSNLAKYDGVRYGTQASQKGVLGNVLFAATRGEGLGEEVRKRILLGAYSLSASAIDNYFIQAQKVRRRVQEDFDRVFGMDNPLISQRFGDLASEKVDVLLTPTAPSTPPTLASLASRSSVETFRDDVMTVPASLAGLPAISLPVPIDSNHKDGERIRSVGIQVIAQYGDDDMLLEFAGNLENLLQSAYHQTPINDTD